jgi:TRAP-type C4-dicarboxylate transport system permease small subunit
MLKIVAIVLIAAGILALVYGGITYTQTTHETKLGPLELSIEDKETIHVPVWAGVAAIVIGGGILLTGRKGALTA